MKFSSILETIGKTPLIKINKVRPDVKAQIFAKLESENPGHSAKDRVANYMIEQAEKEGRLKPGGTIIEATSGNTGFSIAMVSAVKGYKCILAVTDTMSQEKKDLVRALGAQIVICPKFVKAEDPRSYYSQAKKIAEETPNSLYLNQNFDLNNGMAHYYTTGPEIWEATEGKITHYIASAGTGGTISGTAKYLKEKNPDIQIIAVDAYGSVLQKYHETGIFDENEIYPYSIEGTGKTIIPGNVNFDIIDRFVKVPDKESALRCRDLAKGEGILAGHSSGASIQCVFQLAEEGMFDENSCIVCLFSDHGSRYLGKVFNDGWMKQKGFLNGHAYHKNGIFKKIDKVDHITEVHNQFQTK